MKGLVARLLGRAEPTLAEATARDATAIAAVHAASFQRGWGEDEVHQLLIDRAVVGHRLLQGHKVVGFVLSRLAAGEAEILSIAIALQQRGRGLARPLLDQHLRRLAGLGARVVFLEVGEHNAAARALYRRAGFYQVGRRERYYPGSTAAALTLRRDLG